MKRRFGFVSNSLTASFIVAILNQSPEPCPHCGRGGITLTNFLKHHDHWETGTFDLDERMDEWQQDAEVDDCHWAKDVIAKITEAQRAGHPLVCIDLSQHDTGLHTLLKEMELAKEIDILVGDM